MCIYEVMCWCQLDFFLYSGDIIYVDGLIFECIEIESGCIWCNWVIEVKSKVVEIFDEFCGNYCYNLFDDNLCCFNVEVLQIW